GLWVFGVCVCVCVCVYIYILYIYIYNHVCTCLTLGSVCCHGDAHFAEDFCICLSFDTHTHTHTHTHTLTNTFVCCVPTQRLGLEATYAFEKICRGVHVYVHK